MKCCAITERLLRAISRQGMLSFRQGHPLEISSCVGYVPKAGGLTRRASSGYLMNSAATAANAANRDAYAVTECQNAVRPAAPLSAATLSDGGAGASIRALDMGTTKRWFNCLA